MTMTPTPETRAELNNAALEAACYAMGRHVDAELSLEEMKAEAKENPEGFEETKRLTAAGIRAYLAATPAAPAPEPVGPPWMFDRYVDGVLMAEDVQVDDKTTVEAAVRAAVRIANRGPRGSTLALVLRNPPAPVAASAVDHHGWIFHNPDSGVEWSEQHPIESGEVPDAGGVEPATIETMHREMLVAWQDLENERQHNRRLEEDISDATPSSDDSKAARVKPLEWREEPIPPCGEWLASNTLGLYCIQLGHADYPLHLRDKSRIGRYPTLDAAKAAAQADYDRRVWACLETGEAWRTIERAPHETMVMLASPPNRLDGGMWTIEVGYASSGTRYENGFSSVSHHGHATHWMPLPPPPAAEEG